MHPKVHVFMVLKGMHFKWFMLMALLALGLQTADGKKRVKKADVERWPNGEVMDSWFRDTTRVDVATLGRQYVLTDYDVKQDSTLLQTEALNRI